MKCKNKRTCFSSSTMEAPIKEEKKKKIFRQKYGHMASRNLYNLKIVVSFLCFNLFSGIFNKK